VEKLPNRRQSLEGETYDGDTIRLSHTIARKLYRCPGCKQSVEIGSSHILVRYLSPDPAFYQHWHRECAVRDVMRQLKTRRVIPPS
jgi:hypothetical protein